MNDLLASRFARALCAVLMMALAIPLPVVAQQQGAGARIGDHIVAVVNQELVTAGEVESRLARVRENARRNGERVPPDAELRQQVLESLVEERVLITYARDSGTRVEEPELDRAVAGIASQNQLTVPQLRERLRADGIDYTRFRNNVRDQMLVERVREREVQGRIRVTDAEVDRLIEQQRAAAGAQVEYNIAQVLVTVPEGASDAVITERRARAEQALARIRAGEDFAQVARQMSEDGNRERGGEIGLKPVDKLPDVFVQQVRNLNLGDVSPTLLRSGAGFHVLKLLDRRNSVGIKVTQTHARHILLRTSQQASAEAAARRLVDFKRQIEAGRRKFEDLARQYSEDGSAVQGGDLGWVSPGAFVPEFEDAMNKLSVGGVSDPVVSRFGVHLIQVLERREVALDPKQLREQARNVLREQKFEEAYNEWVRDLRARAYIEMREPPQ